MDGLKGKANKEAIQRRQERLIKRTAGARAVRKALAGVYSPVHLSLSFTLCLLVLALFILPTKGWVNGSEIEVIDKE